LQELFVFKLRLNTTNTEKEIHMALKIEAIGVLSQDPKGTKTEGTTQFIVRTFGDVVTCFAKIEAAEARRTYGGGDRVRLEGAGNWNEWNNEVSLAVSGCSVDGSNAEDKLRIKVDGSYGHRLEVQKDDDDEGGGRYIPVEIEATVRGRGSDGEWGDVTAYVQAMVIGKAVDKLLEFDKANITTLCFSGDLVAEPQYIKDQPAFYAEIDDVEPSKGRGSSEDGFWNSKPRGLANRKGAPVKSTSRLPAKKSGGGSGGDPNDPLPF
jgi:hypothetical protein